MGSDDRLESRVDVKTAHEAANVVANRLGGDPKLPRDGVRRMARGEVAENVHLAWREVGGLQ